MAEVRPFIIYALPRSRTAWLSALLSYRDWTCGHELAVTMTEPEDVARLFAQPRFGSIETAAAQGWWIIEHYVPGIRSVVIRRPVEDVVQSLLDVDLGGIAKYDEGKLRRNMEYGDRMLAKIAQRPGVLSIDHADLDDAETCKRVFEFCLPYKFDVAWWESLRERNIQVNVIEHVRYFHANSARIAGFKSRCRSTLRALHKSGALHSEGLS